LLANQVQTTRHIITAWPLGNRSTSSHTMLKTSIPFDPKIDNVAYSIKQSVCNSSHIVVVCGKDEDITHIIMMAEILYLGAGVSLAAGIPTFRGDKSISKTERDLFHINSLTVSLFPRSFLTQSNSLC